jgi:hypothetical protein
MVINSVITTGNEVDDFNKTDIVHAVVELYIRKEGLGKKYARHVGELKKEKKMRPATTTIAVLNAAHQIKSKTEPKPRKVFSMAWLYAEDTKEES